MHNGRFYTLSAYCPDQVGIVAKVSAFFAAHGGWILETAHHSDVQSGLYFMRFEIRADSLPFECAQLKKHFAPLAQSMQMQWRLSDSQVKKRVVILVSHEEHCLYDILARYVAKEWAIDIVGVISNHDKFRGFVEWHNIPFHFVPMSKDTADKAAGFATIEKICVDYQADVIVLARFMQILPADFCERHFGKIINIHHSFLPSFVGAKPYHQAFERGVKLIGATCHFVTANLDAGPIIEQDVIRIDHSDAVDDLIRSGKDIEKMVLSRGLRYFLEDRVLVNAQKTVVFR